MLLTFNPAIADSLRKKQNRFVLASPLDISVFLVDLPRRGFSANTLNTVVPALIKSRCPLSLSEGEWEVKIFGRNRNATFRAAVFMARLKTALRYRQEHDPVIPGTAVLSAAFGALFPKAVPQKSGAKPAVNSALLILVSPSYLEAAFFEDRLIKEHLAINRKTASPIALLKSLCPVQEIPAAIILNGIEAEDEYISDMARHFSECRIAPMSDYSGGVNIKKERIFGTPKKPGAGLLFLPALLAAVLLLSVMRGSLTRLENIQADLARSAAEETKRRERGETLALEIYRLESAEGQAADSEAQTGAYGVIAELYRRLYEGGRLRCGIRSLTIRDDRFSMEAEGQDSLGVLASLENSPLFSNVTLHQTRQEAGAGEVFSLSGSIRRNTKNPE
jgi:hypothetical protein